MKGKAKLQAQVVFNQRALDIVLAIDRVRDISPSPTAMFSGIGRVMRDQFEAGLCLLYVVNRDTGAFELKVRHERDAEWQHIAAAFSENLIRDAMQVDTATIWRAADVLSPVVVAKLPATFSIAVVPVFMGSDPLGTLMMARQAPPFDEHDVQLLQIAESQIDSAIVQAYAHHDLAQRNRELETIYRFDRIRDENLPFDEMLDIVLQDLCRSIEAEMGFVMLYNKEGKRLEMRAVTHPDLQANTSDYESIYQLANDAVLRGEPICYETDAPHCTALCVPLILREEIIGVFGGVNRDPQRRFTADQRRLLMAIVSQMDTAILESLELRRLRRVLGRSLDPRVLERLLAKPDVGILQGERVVLSVLYADLRGSTELSQRLAPELLVEFINDYLGEMATVLYAHQGTLDKFIGDEVMALFGAPLSQPDHALRAVRVGLAMQAAHHSVMQRWEARHVAVAGLGIGIATGEVTVGEIGCEQRTDYTVIGPAANLGARICAVAQPGQVLISQTTYDWVKDDVDARPMHGMHFKGIDGPVTVYDVARA
jgi:adenylate cyclase